MATVANRFSTFQEQYADDEDEDKDYKGDDELAAANSQPQEGWEELPDSSSEDSVLQPPFGVPAEGKMKSKRLRPTRKKKALQARPSPKVKLPKKPAALTGQETCEHELDMLGMPSQPSSLQLAAIWLGFPAKYFGVSSLQPLGRGGGEI
jgi:hypothetical protein